MAVTIVRTSWIDDDGTGTTGTVINNAVKTALYNDIDGGFAKLAQLAGGNAFTGNQAITGGNLTVAGPGPHTFSTASVERVRILATGEVCINTTTNALLGQINLVANLAAVRAVSMQNSDAGNSGTFLLFFNNAGGSAGAIQQASATTVSYGTSSDARLKDDAGRATDVGALRAVVVHDFAWKADGRADRGVFAQDAHAVFPRAISPGTDETTADGHLARPWMTDYSKFVPDLIVGWQHHDADLAELRAAFATLAAEKGL